ncbi:hypothetical protein JCM8115_002213 [Rhodotorula mucilaginosa]
MGTAAGTVARQVVSRAVASAAAASASSRPVGSLAASSSSSSPFRIIAAATAAGNLQPYSSRLKVTSAPPPGPNSSLLEPTWLRRELGRRSGMQGRIAL